MVFFGVGGGGGLYCILYICTLILVYITACDVQLMKVLNKYVINQQSRYIV